MKESKSICKLWLKNPKRNEDSFKQIQNPTHCKSVTMLLPDHKTESKTKHHANAIIRNTI